MARDFMGLKSKDPMVAVKEEVVETSVDSDYPKGSGVPWPSSNKVSALPHFTSFKAAQDEKPPKLISDHLGPPGFMAVPSANGHDLNNKHLPAEIQPVHYSPFSHDIKTPPYSMSNPFFKSLFASSGQNNSSATMKQQLLGGTSVTNPHPVLPCSGFMVGTTEPQFNPNISGAPAQLTIFYAGTVHVYDDISSEKAQAIVCLAGNGCNNSNVPPPKVQVQASASKIATDDGAFVNKFMSAPLCSAVSSPVSISSHLVGQTVVGGADNDETKASKTIGISSTTDSRVETPKIMSSLGPVPASTIMPSAVPQARKASLARFLEMRKERVMNSSPYRLSKKSTEKTNPESDYADFSPTSGAGSNSVSAGKENSRDI